MALLSSGWMRSLFFLSSSGCFVLGVGGGAVQSFDGVNDEGGGRPEAVVDATFGLMIGPSYQGGLRFRGSNQSFETGVLAKACLEYPLVEDAPVVLVGGCGGATLSFGQSERRFTLAFSPFLEPSFAVQIATIPGVGGSDEVMLLLRLSVPMGYDLRHPWENRGPYVGGTVGPMFVFVPKIRF